MVIWVCGASVFSTALRGLQVVCYGCCLGNGDKQTELVAGVPVPARQGEMASGTQQQGMSTSDILCHMLFSAIILKSNSFLICGMSWICVCVCIL